MLRERSVGESLWEAVLPAELRELPTELAKVDAILDDDRFLAPFRLRLTARIGRPTTPIETYLRLMYLKHRYGLGYETLCKEVADSFTWRRFCRIALDGRVPDPSTLMKLTKRLGPELLEELNAELSVARGRAEGAALSPSARGHDDRGGRYPQPDRFGPVRARRLAADAAREADQGGGACAAGAVCATGAARSASGCARSRPRACVAGKRLATLDRLTGEIATRAKQTVREARALAGTARRDARRKRVSVALVERLERELVAAEQILAQTDLRLAGQRTIPDRRVSLVDPDARPIRMGSPTTANRVWLQGARRR